MKLLLMLSIMLFNVFCLANEEVKKYQGWKKLATENNFSWVDSLTKRDLKRINETNQGYNFITKLFSDNCNSELLEQLLNKGVSPKLHSKYDSLGHMMISHANSGCLKVLFNDKREGILRSQKYATSLLNHAILWKNHDAIKFICKFDIDINFKNKLGFTIKDFAMKQDIPLEVMSNCVESKRR